MNEMSAYSLERAFDTISKLESRLHEMEKGVAILGEQEHKVDAIKDLIDDRFCYMERAVDKAEQEMNRRLMGMNEFRDQLKDQAKTFITSDVFESKLKNLDIKTHEMDKNVAILGEHEYRLIALRELIDNRISYMQLAVDKAEKELNYRLMAMNEFREQLTNQAKTFMTFDMYDANHKAIESKIEEIQKIVWGGLAVVSFLVFAIPLVIHFLS